MHSSAPKNKKIINKVPHFKTALITGVTSYLGASLAEKLIRQGWRVVGLGSAASAFEGYLKLFESNPRFYFFRADISSEIPANIKSVDAVFHLYKNKPHLARREKSPLGNFLDITESAKHILDFATQTRAALLMASGLQNGALPFYKAQEFLEILTLQYCKEKKTNARIVRLPNYYGKYFLKEKPDHPLAQLIKQALKGNALTVKGSGLDRDYYHHIDDLTAGLQKALFTSNTRGKIFPLCDMEGITSLELAYTIKAVAPKAIEVKFDTAEAAEDYPEQSILDAADSKELDWQASIPLKEGLRPLLIKEPQREKPEFKPPKLTVPKINSPKLEKFKIKISKRDAMLTLLLALPLLFPPAYLGINLGAGVWRLRKAAAGVSALDFETAGKNAQGAADNFRKTYQFLNRVKPLAETFGKERYQNTKRFLLSGQYGSEALYYESEGLKTMKQAVEAIIPYSTIPPPKESGLIEASANLSKGLERYQLLAAESEQLKKERIPKALRPYFDFFDQNREEIRSAFGTLFETSKSMPELLGLIEPQNYLILLQNNQELRSGGGFIGSYALISLDKGKTKGLKTDDIYNLDGILQENKLGIAAPPRFLKYLGVSTVYLRDSNFSPDFSENAQRAIDLYGKATGTKINGVIAVNLSLAQNLLEKVGPVETPEYGQIDGASVLEKAVFFAEKDYFKGAQNKKSFLSALTTALIEKFTQAPDKSFRAAAALLLEALDSKEALAYFPQSNLQETLVKRGWGGKVEQDPKADFLMLVEENLGANKANYSIKRNIKYEVSERGRQGALKAQLTISYLNTAETSRWPLGTYKVYGQVLTSQGNKTFYKEIKPQENYIKTLSWELPPQINSQKYKLKVQKQPGMEGTSFSFFYSPILGGEPYSFEGYLTKDLEFAINNGWN